MTLICGSEMAADWQIRLFISLVTQSVILPFLIMTFGHINKIGAELSVISLPHYFISDHDWCLAQKCLSCVVFSATTLPYSFTNS